MDVLKFVYGEDNVEAITTGIELKATDLPEVVIVVDMILKGGIFKAYCRTTSENYRGWRNRLSR